jgi:hypothetical protein
MTTNANTASCKIRQPLLPMMWRQPLLRLPLTVASRSRPAAPGAPAPPILPPLEGLLAGARWLGDCRIRRCSIL